MPGNVRLHKGEGGIPKASVINVSQIHSIDRHYIQAKVGALSSDKFKLVKQGLRTLFDLA